MYHCTLEADDPKRDRDAGGFAQGVASAWQRRGRQPAGRGGALMRIAIITDAWTPQVNGVVTTLANVTSELAQMGHELFIVSPELATRKLGLPRCNELELAFTPRGKVARMLDSFAPEAIHIATEGPIGITAGATAWRAG